MPRSLHAEARLPRPEGDATSPRSIATARRRTGQTRPYDLVIEKRNVTAADTLDLHLGHERRCGHSLQAHAVSGALDEARPSARPGGRAGHVHRMRAATTTGTCHERRPRSVTAPRRTSRVQHPEWTQARDALPGEPAPVHAARARWRAREKQLPRLQGARRRHRLADADPSDRREEPQGQSRQPVLRARLSRGKSGVRHARRPEALRCDGARTRHARDPRLGREPHGVGQPARDAAPRVVLAQLERRLSPDVVERLGGHHRARLRPAGPAQVHDRRAEVLGARSRHRRLSLRRCGVRAARLLEQRAPRTRRDQARVHAGRMGGDRPAPGRLRRDVRVGLVYGRARGHRAAARASGRCAATTRRRTTPIRARRCA